MTGARYNAYREGLSPITSLAAQMLDANEHVIKVWVDSSMKWAAEMKANPPPNAPGGLLRRIMQVEAVMPYWPIRPFYSMSELALLFPALSEQMMGNKGGRYKNYTPEQISSGLRTSGIKTLQNSDDIKGFRYQGIVEPFLVIADVNNEAWKKPFTQAEFDRIMLTFGTYAELPGVKVAPRRVK